MKKFLLLLIVLQSTTILYSQTEVVIETFDDGWGADGLPAGYVWYNDWGWEGAVFAVPGYNGTGMKLVDIYSDMGESRHFTKILNYAGKVPDSVRVYMKLSSPTMTSQQACYVHFMNNELISTGYAYIGSDYWPLGWWPVTRGVDKQNSSYFNSIQINFDVYRGPNTNNESGIYDEITLIWNSTIQLIEPTAGDKWIAGEKGLIKWSALNNEDTLRIEFSIDGGQTYALITDSIEAFAGQYEWDIPADILTTKARIKLTNLNDNNTAESDNIKIKPYIITKLDGNGDYIAYDIDFDRWGFGNYTNDMWPSSYWYGRFDYNNGIDPFTNNPYNQRIVDSTFYYAFAFEYPDWPSFVRAFGVDNCYWSTVISRYKSSAVLKWKSKKRFWGGSCFGIAAANALAFRKRSEFQSKYPTFSGFVDPINVSSDSTVIPVITELFTQQYGFPTVLHRDYNWNPYPGKTVNQTLNELKAMLREDNTPIRTLSMWNNNGSWGSYYQSLPSRTKSSGQMVILLMGVG